MRSSRYESYKNDLRFFLNSDAVQTKAELEQAPCHGLVDRLGWHPPTSNHSSEKLLERRSVSNNHKLYILQAVEPYIHPVDILTVTWIGKLDKPLRI